MQPSYFTGANIASACTTSSNSRQLPTRKLRLHFSARDLPEPDARSRASYAVVYHAIETPQTPISQPNPSSNLPSAPTIAQKPPNPFPSSSNQNHHVSILSDASADSASSSPNNTNNSTSLSRSDNRYSSTSPPTTPDAKLVRKASMAVKNPKKSSAVRAPHVASVYAAPRSPTSYLAPDGTSIVRTAWKKLGTTEVARKSGRDVEYANSFVFTFNPSDSNIIRVVFYDCTSSKVEKQRLIGTAEFTVLSVFAAKGKPVTYPLMFMPVTKKDVKRSAKIPVGGLIVVGERVSGDTTKYLLDVECTPIIRTKTFSSTPVKRLFYTIHGILDSDKDSDHWTLLFRSHAVEMIHTKRDGGSLEYNHFSSCRLVPGPGLEGGDEDGRKAGDKSGGVTDMLGKVLRIKKREQFFSLPGANVLLDRDDTKLKLTLYEDCGQLAGFFFIANTELTIENLKHSDLRSSSLIKVHANVVGKASLKYTECSDTPRYFCLSLDVGNLR